MSLNYFKMTSASLQIKIKVAYIKLAGPCSFDAISGLEIHSFSLFISVKDGVLTPNPTGQIPSEQGLPFPSIRNSLVYVPSWNGFSPWGQIILCCKSLSSDSRC